MKIVVVSMKIKLTTFKRLAGGESRKSAIELHVDN